MTDESRCVSAESSLPSTAPHGSAHATGGSSAGAGDLSVAPAVVATKLSLSGHEGPVYGPLNLTVPGRGVTVITGRGGSGRTALALTLSGRMSPGSGQLTVLGQTSTTTIRRLVAVAGIDDVDLIDRDVTVKNALAEHRAWCSPWWKWVQRVDSDYEKKVCGVVFGDRALPPLGAYVSQISALDRHLLRISLALSPARHGSPRMLVMDDPEQVREHDDRAHLVTTLTRLSTTLDIPVVVTAVNPPPPGAPPHHHIDLGEATDRGHTHSQAATAATASDPASQPGSQDNSLGTKRSQR